MVEEKVIIKSEKGLMAREASYFVKEAAKFQSQITIIKEGQEHNGKSIISVLSLGLVEGDEIIIRCEGEDELIALESLVELIIDGFEHLYL